MPQNRNERLAADYRDMLKIQDQPFLSWIVTKGEPPYAEEYLLKIGLRSYVYSQKSGKCVVGVMHSCTVQVALWPSYPDVAPYVRMLNIPPVFHPAWYSKGTYCPPEPWRAEASLKEFVKQMLGTIQYDPFLIDSASPANYKALEWYLKNRDNVELFPSDTTELTEKAIEASVGNQQDPFDEVVDSWTVG